MKGLFGIFAAAGLVLFAMVAGGASAPLGGSSGSGRFRKAVLAEAKKAQGIRESGGKNRGKEVDQYLANVGQAPGQNWCAAAAWTWIRDAAKVVGGALGALVLQKIKPTAGAQALMAEFRSAGWFVSAADVRSGKVPFPPPGSLAFWDRSQPPGTSWQGHVGAVSDRLKPPTKGANVFSTIEGNSGAHGDQVISSPDEAIQRTIDDPRLLGFGVFPEEA